MKLIPLALALSLLVGALTQFEDNIRAIVDGQYESDLTIESVAYLVAPEIALRLANDAIRGAIKAASRRRSRPSTPPDAVDASDTK